MPYAKSEFSDELEELPKYSTLAFFFFLPLLRLLNLLVGARKKVWKTPPRVCSPEYRREISSSEELVELEPEELEPGRPR